MSRKPDANFIKLARATAELVGPGMTHLVHLAMELPGAHPVGAVVILTVKTDDTSPEKYVRASMTGCRCPECLQAAIRALRDAFGAQAEIETETLAAQVH